VQDVTVAAPDWDARDPEPRSEPMLEERIREMNYADDLEDELVELMCQSGVTTSWRRAGDQLVWHLRNGNSRREVSVSLAPDSITVRGALESRLLAVVHAAAAEARILPAVTGELVLPATSVAGPVCARLRAAVSSPPEAV
jgi:hypothetical protein